MTTATNKTKDTACAWFPSHHNYNDPAGADHAEWAFALLEVLPSCRSCTERRILIAMRDQLACGAPPPAAAVPHEDNCLTFEVDANDDAWPGDQAGGPTSTTGTWSGRASRCSASPRAIPHHVGGRTDADGLSVPLLLEADSQNDNG